MYWGTNQTNNAVILHVCGRLGPILQPEVSQDLCLSILQFQPGQGTQSRPYRQEGGHVHFDHLLSPTPLRSLPVIFSSLQAFTKISLIGRGAAYVAVGSRGGRRHEEKQRLAGSEASPSLVGEGGSWLSSFPI